MRRVTIITGPRDAGKTRCVTAFLERLRAAGTSAGGVIAEAQVNEGRKVGYTFRDVMSDGRAPYAVSRAAPRGGGPGYTFLERGLAFGRAAIARAVSAGVAVLIVDEIGPLEMEGEGLWTAVEEAAAHLSGSIVLTVRPSLVEALCARLAVSDEDVEVLPPEDCIGLSP